MITTFSSPLAGGVLDVLVEVLDLRAFDKEEVLRRTNARRYLRGERVSPEAEEVVLAAVANALVEADLVPRSLTTTDVLPDPPLGAPDVLPGVIVAALFLKEYARRWDVLAGALRRATAPLAFPKHAAGACLRLVAIDLALRIAAIAWLSRVEDEQPLSDFWTKPNGVGLWLRELLKRPGVSRDEFAEAVGVAANTLDGWLDDDGHPVGDNIRGLGAALAKYGVGDEATMLRRVRLAFAARRLFKKVEATIGTPQALGIGQRLVFYSHEMLRLPRMSRNPPVENDFKMKFALFFGTLDCEARDVTWVASMVKHLWRNEQNPVWRTTLVAVTRSWFEHLQEVTAKLGPVDKTKLAEVLGRVPTREDLDRLAYQVQGTKAEWALVPGAAEAMLIEATRGGERGALELKIRANEAYARGDLLGAVELLRLAIAKNPTDADLHFRLGGSLSQVGDVSAGLIELEIAVQLNPSWDRAHVEIAIVLLNEGRYEEALVKLVVANAELPAATPWLLFNLANAHERLGHMREAVDAYEQLLSLEGDHAEALDRVAHLHFLLGNQLSGQVAAKQKRAGAAAAKKAAHLGISTVFDAWERGYYDRRALPERPPHDPAIDGLLHFRDSAAVRASARRDR